MVEYSPLNRIGTLNLVVMVFGEIYQVVRYPYPALKVLQTHEGPVVQVHGGSYQAPWVLQKDQELVAQVP